MYCLYLRLLMTRAPDIFAASSSTFLPFVDDSCVGRPRAAIISSGAISSVMATVGFVGAGFPSAGALPSLLSLRSRESLRRRSREYDLDGDRRASLLWRRSREALRRRSRESDLERDRRGRRAGLIDLRLRRLAGLRRCRCGERDRSFRRRPTGERDRNGICRCDVTELFAECRVL